MVLLPGVPDETRRLEGGARAALGAFGRHLGSVIYLIDALDDLEKDHRGGAFNPCLVAGRAPRGGALRVSWPRVDLAWGLLHDDLVALLTLVETLPLRRHRELVRSVVAVELPRLARGAATRAHAYAKAEERARRQVQPWPVRALAAVATAFVLLWVWLSSIPALAQKSPRRAPDAGAPDAGDAGKGSVVPPVWLPKLPASSSASPSPPEPEKKPPPAGTTIPRDPPAPGTATGGTSPPPSPGGGFTNPCSGCSGCGSGANPCSGCTSCCDAGKGCDCGGCCKVCDSGNACCGSCNGGCGSCCK